MAHESGTSSGRVVGIGVGGDGEIGVGRGVSRSQTGVAKLTAPPANQGDVEFIAMLIFVVGVPLAVLFISLALTTRVIAIELMVASAAVMGIAAYFWSQKRLPKHQGAYKAAMTKWEHSWICLRCGHTFYIR